MKYKHVRSRFVKLELRFVRIYHQIWFCKGLHSRAKNALMLRSRRGTRAKRRFDRAVFCFMAMAAFF